MKLRRLLGVSLVAGVLVGLWLADLFKGFGGGYGLGITANAPATSSTSETSETKQPGESANAGKADLGVGTKPSLVGKSLRVVLRDWTFHVQYPGDEVALPVAELVETIEKLPGDSDGIRLRIYRTGSARPSAEAQLRDALKAARVPERAVYWSPDVIEEPVKPLGSVNGKATDNL